MIGLLGATYIWIVILVLCLGWLEPSVLLIASLVLLAIVVVRPLRRVARHTAVARLVEMGISKQRSSDWQQRAGG
jgi:hypothetical protein